MTIWVYNRWKWRFFWNHFIVIYKLFWIDKTLHQIHSMKHNHHPENCPYPIKYIFHILQRSSHHIHHRPNSSKRSKIWILYISTCRSDWPFIAIFSEMNWNLIQYSWVPLRCPSSTSPHRFPTTIIITAQLLRWIIYCSTCSRLHQIRISSPV